MARDDCCLWRAVTVSEILCRLRSWRRRMKKRQRAMRKRERAESVEATMMAVRREAPSVLDVAREVGGTRIKETI